jgi:hypothetical protein
VNREGKKVNREEEVAGDIDFFHHPVSPLEILYLYQITVNEVVT